MEVKELVKALLWLAKDTEFVFAADTLLDSASALESMREELDRVKAERDVAINDLKAGAWCENCAHYADMAECGEIPMCNVCHVECYCKDCNDGNKWAWRGLKEE